MDVVDVAVAPDVLAGAVATGCGETATGTGTGAGENTACGVTLKTPNGLSVNRLGPTSNGLKTRDWTFTVPRVATGSPS